MADPTEFSVFNGTSPRNKARESTYLTANITFAGREDVLAARVRNISSGGVMVDCPTGAIIGDTVLVEVKNLGRVSGRVAWSVPPRVGIEFDSEIDPKAARFKVSSAAPDPTYAGLAKGTRRPGLTIR